MTPPRRGGAALFAMNTTPHFNLLVQFGPGGQVGRFEGCSGLDDVIAEYRSHSTPTANDHQTPSADKGNLLILNRGLVRAKEFQQWPAISPRTVTISLLDRYHNSVRTWRAIAACVMKFTSAPLSGSGADVAMEELTLIFEGFEPTCGEGFGRCSDSAQMLIR